MYGDCRQLLVVLGCVALVHLYPAAASLAHTPEDLGEIVIAEADDPAFSPQELSDITRLMECFEDSPGSYGLYRGEGLSKFRERIAEVEVELNSINAAMRGYQPRVDKLKFEQGALVEAANRHNEEVANYGAECAALNSLDSKEYESACAARQRRLEEEEVRLRNSWRALAQRVDAWHETYRGEQEKVERFVEGKLKPLLVGMKKAAERRVPWVVEEIRGYLFKNNERVETGHVIEFNVDYQLSPGSTAVLRSQYGSVLKWHGAWDKSAVVSLAVEGNELGDRPCNFKEHVWQFGKGAFRWTTGKAKEIKEGGRFGVRNTSRGGGVRGTDFIIDAKEDGETQVIVLEGGVYWEAAGREEEITLGAGEQLVIAPDGTLGQVTLADLPAVERQYASLLAHQTAPDIAAGEPVVITAVSATAPAPVAHGQAATVFGIPLKVVLPTLAVLAIVAALVFRRRDISRRSRK